MADTHSVASNDLTNVPLQEHIKQVSMAFDSCIKLSKVISEARGKGELKPGRKIKLADGREVGMDDLNAYVSKIKTALKEIPRIVTAEKKAEKERKRSRHLTRENTPQPPCQYGAELVEFFDKVDLGKSPDGSRRLQDHPEMAMFFKSGVCNLTFGVSLFNVWGNIYKLRNGSTEIVLDATSQRALSGALTELKNKKRSIITHANLSSSDAAIRAEAEKARTVAEADLARIESNRIHNKDYMSILSFYRIKENPNDLSAYTEGVAHMSDITKKLNAEYGAQVKEHRATVAKTAKATAAPVATTTSAPALAPVPALPSLKAPGAPPSIPTIGTRAISPGGRAGRR
jgi:hypothetical protein